MGMTKSEDAFWPEIGMAQCVTLAEEAKNGDDEIQRYVEWE